MSVDDSMLRIPVLELDKIPLDKKIIEMSKAKSQRSN
jgi:hypothetical protein